MARKLNIRIVNHVVMSNHIHLCLKLYQRRSLLAFLRGANGLIARAVLGAKKGHASSLSNFFPGRSFSRIVAQGRKSFQSIQNYFILNRLEKCGFSKEESRKLGLVEIHKGAFDNWKGLGVDDQVAMLNFGVSITRQTRIL